MKRIVFILFACGLLLPMGFLSSCGDSSKEREQRYVIDSLENANFQLKMDHEDLQRYLSVIADGFDSIAIQENELLPTFDIEGGRFNRQRIKQNLEQVQEKLLRNRERIDALEQQLQNGNANTSKLKSIISALRQQLDEKEQEIIKLKATLEGNKKDVAVLKKQLAKMNEEQQVQENLIQEQKEMIEEQQKQMSSGFVKIGTKKELKKLGLLSGGFLKKTKVDYSQIDISLFDEVDLNTKSSFALPSKYKIMTPVPEGSYNITRDASGGNILEVTDPAKFWSVSKFLIIQID